MPIEPFAMPKGQLMAIIGHFGEGYRILLRASSPLSTTKATKASKTLPISAATKATTQPLMRLMRSLVIFPHLQPLITRHRLVAGENNPITRHRFTRQRFGVRGAIKQHREGCPFAASGRGLGLGFFAPRHSLADATVTRPLWAHFFSLSPQLFFAYFCSLTPRIFA